MKKTWIIIGVVSIIVILVGINVWQARAKTNIAVETVNMSEEKIRETVLTPGTLKLKNEQVVYYEPEKGEIAEILVATGDKVKKGAALLRYENKQLELEQKQIELQVRSSSLQLENIRKQHRDLDKQIEQDTENNEMLQQQHDEIKMQESITQIELEQSQLQQEVIKQQLDDLTVKAEFAGTVLAVNETASTDALAQEPLIQIGSLQDFYVEGTISEYDTMKISVGQKVTLTSDAVPDKEWQGTVAFIGDMPANQAAADMMQDSTSVLYPIKIDIEDEIKLKPGFNMLIEIITREETVQALPVEVVLQEDDEHYVYIVEEGKAKRVDVKIGTVDTQFIEIVDGLDKDADVIIRPPEELDDGTEVTIK